MLSCREITRLASARLDGADPPLGTRMGMGLHLMLCRHCARYVRQLRVIGELAGRYASARLQDADDLAPMPEGARQRLARRLRDAADQDRGDGHLPR